MATSIPVITNEQINLFQINKLMQKSFNKKVNQPWVAWISKYLHLEHEDDRYTLSVQTE